MQHNEKYLRRQKYKDFLIKRDGFMLTYKDRGEFIEYEDATCLAYFERPYFSAPHKVEIKLKPKLSEYVITEIDLNKIQDNLTKHFGFNRYIFIS